MVGGGVGRGDGWGSERGFAVGVIFRWVWAWLGPVLGVSGRYRTTAGGRFVCPSTVSWVRIRVTGGEVPYGAGVSGRGCGVTLVAGVRVLLISSAGGESAHSCACDVSVGSVVGDC